MPLALRRRSDSIRCFSAQDVQRVCSGMALLPQRQRPRSLRSWRVSARFFGFDGLGAGVGRAGFRGGAEPACLFWRLRLVRGLRLGTSMVSTKDCVFGWFIPVLEPGLSPRVRGNHVTGDITVTGTGSIPARAGEPRPTSTTYRASSVYPRACGGTTADRTDPDDATGLSPRVRGNHHPQQGREPLTRSIPARAGEPETQHTPAPWIAVYPRACGGTSRWPTLASLSVGLSPRVRGNRLRPRRHRPCWRSIPARAGEPRSPFRSAT